VKMSNLEQALYLGHSVTPCPYLPQREASLLFLNGTPHPEVYRALLDSGYRRYGYYMYRPDCEGCTECKVIRVPVATFTRSKDQRRIWNRGQRLLRYEFGDATYTREKLDLYRRYLRDQHKSDEAADVDEQRYRSFFVDSFLGECAAELRIYKDDLLLAVGILDVMPNALSSVYFFFDPVYSRYSLGTYGALLEIELARSKNLAYYYLGYYIAECPSMNYKARYRPCELKDCDDNSWRVLDR
jgi:arginyl-tRNA--protein-N-Asp/Glu arginylyltransferase